MITHEKPVKIEECNRVRYTRSMNNKKIEIKCRGLVKMYKSVANDYLQGVCEDCDYTKGIKK